MVKVSKEYKGTMPVYGVVTDDKNESIIYDVVMTDIQEARRIVQIINSSDHDMQWDEIKEIMDREGFYL